MNSAARRELPSMDRYVRVPEQVLLREVGGEIVMLDLGREQYYGMNEVGARLMQLAENGATLGDIAARLFEEFDAERAQIDADVRRVAAELLDSGLLEDAPAP